MIACGWHIQHELGIAEGTVLEINTLGDAPSRDAYRAALALVRNPAERQYLEKRLRACGDTAKN